MKYKIIIVFCLALFQFETANAQVYERSKTETRTFKVYKETSLEISNKYGNIHLFTWEKDSVKIDIDVLVKANKESKVDKIFEYIDFEFTSTKYYIVAKTQLRQNQSSFWSEVSDLANTIFSGSNKAQINYSVYLPIDMEIKLENKFGNIYLSDYNGETTIKLSNGDLKANDFKGFTTINLSFGNASINSMDKGKMDVGYAEIELGRVNELELMSKSSMLNINRVGLLKISSRRDKYHLGELGTLTGNTSFSYLKITDFLSSMDVVTVYGEVKIEHINTVFKRIEVESKYTDIYLNFPSTISCSLNVDHTEATGIYYPDVYKDIKVEVIDKKEDIYKTSGYIGKQAVNNKKIDISLISGKLVIKDTVEDY